MLCLFSLYCCVVTGGPTGAVVVVLNAADRGWKVMRLKFRSVVSREYTEWTAVEEILLGDAVETRSEEVMHLECSGRSDRSRCNHRRRGSYSN